MLALRYERTLAASPAVAWSLLTDPDRMNAWSTARIESAALGDGRHPAGTGALRRVHLPRPGGVLTEVIERAEAPCRLAYRVVAGAPVRRHLGVVELRGAGPGTRVTWTVEVEPLVPALAPVLRRLLDRELGRSLDRLVEVCPGAAATPPPPARELDRLADLAALRRTADLVAEQQGRRGAALIAGGDPRGYFGRVYHHVTRALLAAVDEARFDHPAWVLRLIPVFDRYFDDNLLAPAPEPHWQRAFAAIGRARDRGAGPFELATTAVVAGMRAHIEDDLPRTLARVYVDHYGPRGADGARCDPARFRPDYLRMRDLFVRAGDRFLAELPRRTWSRYARAVDALTPGAWREGLIDRHVYPITRERARAFERGELLAALLVEQAAR